MGISTQKGTLPGGICFYSPLDFYKSLEKKSYASGFKINNFSSR
jgi:hypothetical protein